MRFINEDTKKGDVKDPLSLNLYTYCQGNPIRYVDVDGHSLLDTATLQLLDGLSICGGADPATLTYLLYEVFNTYAQNPSMQYVIQNGDKIVASADKVKDKIGGGQGNVPNPNGKKGGPEHQKLIKEIIEFFKNKGFDVEPEKYIKIFEGFKKSRYGDVLISNIKTGEEWIIQVGKQTSSGFPVSREIKAIIDLMSKGYKVIFIPYN